MRHTTAATLRGGALTLILLLSLAACAPSAQIHTAPPHPTPATPTAPPKITPAMPSLQTISLGNFKADWVLAGAAGLVLQPPAPPLSGPPRSGTVYPTSLAFYRYSTQRVEQLATAPTGSDGAVGGIVGATYGGDWVAYATVDAQQSNTVLWAYNVATGERVQVDSAARDPGLYFQTSGWVSTGTDLVWSIVNFNSGGQTATSKLEDFSYTTRQTQTLYTDPTHIVMPAAMNQTSILLQTSDSATNSTWLLLRDQHTLTQITDQATGPTVMNAHYLLWSDAHTMTTALYDLSTGKLTPSWATCIRPVIADSRPYVVCLDFDANTRVLLHVPDGGATPFEVGTADVAANITQYNGRVFWVASQTGSEGASTINYFDLPTQ